MHRRLWKVAENDWLFETFEGQTLMAVLLSTPITIHWNSTELELVGLWWFKGRLLAHNHNNNLSVDLFRYSTWDVRRPKQMNEE